MNRANSQWAHLRVDLDRYCELYPGYPQQSTWKRLRIAFGEESFWSIAWYRFGRWAKHELHVPILRGLCVVLYKLGFRPLRALYGISIPADCEAGPGLYFGHFGGVWINPRVKLGRYVSIMHGVTIGKAGQEGGVPEIGDFVYVGPQATVAGRIKVGNGCVLGANSLIVTDVPDGGTAVGVPARVVLKGGNPISERAMQTTVAAGASSGPRGRS